MRFGVDEAGKGPVLGSMFAAAVCAAQSDLPDGVGDSKAIAPARREELAAEIRSVADAVGVSVVPVETIDDPETDMNTLTVVAHARALAAVADSEGTDSEETSTEVASESLVGMVDAGDTNAERFGERVASRVETDLSLTAEHGADESDPLVGAASIVAKVERDAHVETLADEYGPVGSGYPSDQTTRRFLREYVTEHGELPACARTSWSTCEDVLAATEQANLEEF